MAASCIPKAMVTLMRASSRAPERTRAANGRRVKYVRHGDAARTLRNHTPDVRSKPHFVEHVVRVDVGANAHVDPATHVAPEVVQRDAAARKYGWAMRDRRTGARQRL